MVPHNICSESTGVGVCSHHLTLMVRTVYCNSVRRPMQTIRFCLRLLKRVPRLVTCSKHNEVLIFSENVQYTVTVVTVRHDGHGIMFAIYYTWKWTKAEHVKHLHGLRSRAERSTPTYGMNEQHIIDNTCLVWLIICLTSQHKLASSQQFQPII